MADSVGIGKDDKMRVTFSGNKEVLSDKVDAISTRLELTNLDY